MREALSTARPTTLRLFGALALAVGGALMGLGALLDWGSVGFPEEIDPRRSVVGPIRGTDLWEGVLVFGAAFLILVGLLALRLARSDATRFLIAIAITVLGLGAAAVTVLVARDATERFAGAEGIQAYAETLAPQLELPVDQVRSDIESQFRDLLVVQREAGLWIALAGGLAAGAGGVLGLVWVRRHERDHPVQPRPSRPLLG